MISNKFVLSIINQVNPLWLPNEDGTGCVFASYADCYVYFMDKCHEIAPKGYMDLFVLVAELYGWNFSKSVGFYKNFAEKRMGERITMLKVGEGNNKAFYRKFITCLHDYYNTSFDLQAFSNAWEIHKNHVLSNQFKVTDYGTNNQKEAEGNTQQ